MKAFMTVKEVAEHLGIKSKTVYAWANGGKLPAFKIHGALRFRIEDITAFINTCKVVVLNPARIARKILGKKLCPGDNARDSGQRVP